MVSISKMGLGTAQFGIPYGISNRRGQTPAGEVSRILEVAEANGIHVLDTAASYGTAEAVLGRQNLEPFRLISKFLPREKEGVLERQLLRTLERMNTDSLAGYLAHRPDSLLEEPWLWEELRDLRERGLVDKIGYSLNLTEELDRLLKAGFVPDLVQVPLNYFDRRFVPYFSELKGAGCEIHVRSVFLQGLFFMSSDELNHFFEEIKPILRELQEFTENLSGALLRFALDQPEVDRVIVGVEHSKQLLANLESLKSATRLPPLAKSIPEHILAPVKWPATD